MNQFLRFGFFLTALHLFSGALGYVYQILIGRFLHPAEFGLFSSIMALLMFIFAPLSAISMVIVRKVSNLKAQEKLHLIKSLFQYINKVLFIIGTLVILIFWFAKPYLELYLKIENSSTLIFFICIVILSLFHTVGIAFIQGLQWFIWLGLFGFLGVLGKVVLSVIFIKIGLGVHGALLGVLSAVMVVYGIIVLILFKYLPSQIIHHPFRLNFDSIKQILPVLAATVSFAALTQLDMTIVNWFFQAHEAGLYAAASVLGKAVLYLPGGFILVLFPIVAENHANKVDSFKIFQQASLLTLLLCAAIAGFYWIFGIEIIKLLYGSDYKGAGEILRWYGLAILPLALVIIAEHYLIAQGQVLFAWLFLLLLPIVFFAIYTWHTELWMILAIMGSFGFLLVIIGYVLMWRASKLT